MTKRTLRMISATCIVGAFTLLYWVAYLEKFMPPNQIHWASFPNIMLTIGLVLVAAIVGAHSTD